MGRKRGDQKQAKEVRVNLVGATTEMLKIETQVASELKIYSHHRSSIELLVTALAIDFCSELK